MSKFLLLIFPFLLHLPAFTQTSKVDSQFPLFETVLQSRNGNSLCLYDTIVSFNFPLPNDSIAVFTQVFEYDMQNREILEIDFGQNGMPQNEWGKKYDHEGNLIQFSYKYAYVNGQPTLWEVTDYYFNGDNLEDSLIQLNYNFALDSFEFVRKVEHFYNSMKQRVQSDLYFRSYPSGTYVQARSKFFFYNANGSLDSLMDKSVHSPDTFFMERYSYTPFDSIASLATGTNRSGNFDTTALTIYEYDLQNHITEWFFENSTSISNYKNFYNSNGDILKQTTARLSTTSEVATITDYFYNAEGCKTYSDFFYGKKFDFSDIEFATRRHYRPLDVVSVNEWGNSSTVQISPNPTSGKITISPMEFERAIVFDKMGRQVATFTNTESLDLSNMSSGLYFLRLFDGNRQSVHRLVKF